MGVGSSDVLGFYESSIVTLAALEEDYVKISPVKSGKPKGLHQALPARNEYRSDLASMCRHLVGSCRTIHLRFRFARYQVACMDKVLSSTKGTFFAPFCQDLLHLDDGASIPILIRKQMVSFDPSLLAMLVSRQPGRYLFQKAA